MANATWGRGAEEEEANPAPTELAAAAPIPPANYDGLTPHQFRFHGSGREYFGIWIVNILLSIVTLGIYSAWAKVRTKRYFNGNTELAGHRFDYHAEPIQILKGRIVVVVVLVALNLLSQLHPALALVVFAVYMIALPWVIVRGLAFNANMTSYRNVRFHFHNTKWKAFSSFIAWPFAAMLTLGALVPFASRAAARFLGNGHMFGQSHFAADPPLGPYYKGLGLVYLLVFGPLLFIGLIFGGAYFAGGSGDILDAILGGTAIIAVLIFYAGLIFAFVIYSVYSRNNGFNHLTLQNGHRFLSTMRVLPFVWIVASNLVLIIVTLTLYSPWARVRMARYLADNTTMYAADNLDNFVGQQVQGTGVTSGEFLDIEGFDFGF